MRDSGLDISYALEPKQFQKRASFTNAADNGFTVGTYEDLIQRLI
jgi:ketol-acid reductoisomerase